MTSDKMKCVFVEDIKIKQYSSLKKTKKSEESYNNFFNKLKHWFYVFILERKRKAINNNEYSIFDSDEVKQIRNTLDATDTILKVTRSNGAKIEFDKTQHYLGLIQKLDNKIKTVWNIIKKDVTKPVIAANANISAGELNDFFANVGEKVNNSLGPQTSDEAMQLLKKSLPKIDLTFTLYPTSDFEVSNIMSRMKSKNTQDI
ncbi:hypothetical protein HHI36_007970 [Cryptolaemus montrouzieri]|uniref:Uncharacterized protein n=1 Tax=Cryptolaemus montrouzieri TaxID=559131 RepID=A0ABD2MR41_9CUCU